MGGYPAVTRKAERTSGVTTTEKAASSGPRVHSWSAKMSIFNLNPFIPKFKKYILPIVLKKIFKWGSENW